MSKESQGQSRDLAPKRSIAFRRRHHAAERFGGQAARGPKPWPGYAAAVVGTVLAALLRWWLGLLVGTKLPPFITFYPMVMFAALLGGVGPGLLATALATLAVAFFFLPPAGLGVTHPADQLGLALFFAINIAISIFCGRLWRTHNAMRSSEVRYRRLFEASHDGVLLLDPATHVITGANPFISELLHYSREELLGKQLWQIGLLRDEQASRAAFDQLSSEGRIRCDDLALQAKTGETCEVEFVSNVYDEDGRSVIQCTIRDMTDRKQAQRALLREKEFSDHAINSLPGVFYLFDAQNHLRRWNQNFESLSGYSGEEMRRLTALDFVAPEDRAAAAQAIAKVLSTGEASAELLFLTKDGRKLPFAFTGRRLEVDGQPGFLGVGLDITERKEAELELTGVRDQLAAELDAMRRLQGLSTRLLQQEDPRTLLDVILDAAIAIVRADKGNLQVVNLSSGELAISVQRGFDAAFVEFFSHIHRGQAACGTAMQTRQCVVVEDITLSPIFAAQPRALQLKLAAGVRAVTCTPLLTRSGSLVGVLSVHFAAPHRPTERDLRLLDLLARQAADFTDRSRAEQQLRDSETRLRLAVQTAELGTYERDLLSNQITMNQTCLAILGVSTRPFAPDVARQSAHPDDRERVYAAVARAFDPAIREVCAAEFRILRPDGTTRWVSGRGRVIFDDTVKPPRACKFLGVLSDITERKLAEEQLLQAKDELARINSALERTVQERTAKLQETVADLEHFSYTIAHDMRAPLRAMRAFGQMLLTDSADCMRSDRRDLLRRISDAALRMDHLVTDALKYSNVIRSEFQLRPVAPEALIRGIVESYPQFQPPQAEITIEPDMPHVLANEAALTQCFSNFLGNAVKFVAPGVTPRIRVWAETRGGARSPSAPSHAAPLTHHASSASSQLSTNPSTHQSTVLIWFEDNGIGIEPEYHDKIWGMFQRLSKSFEGTGIGLALVRKVVDRMRGKVGVQSQPGRGSRFWIELQRADDPMSKNG